MNALGESFEAMKQLLTTGSKWRFLGSDALLKIEEVKRSSLSQSSDLQNLGVITNLGYTSFPPEFGASLDLSGSLESDGEDGPSVLALDFGREGKEETEAAASSLAETDTSMHTQPATEQKKPSRVHLPKVKKKPTLKRPLTPASGQPPYTLQLPPDSTCPTCRWIFPATLDKDALRRHRDLAAAGKCSAEISEFREAQRAVRRSKVKNKPKLPEAQAWYGGVRQCPHCQLLLQSGLPAEAKKEHIEECRTKRKREEDKEQFAEVQLNIVRPEPPLDPFALKFSTLLKKARFSFEAPTN